MKKYLTIAKSEWLNALQNPEEVFVWIVLETIPVFIMGSLWMANKNNLLHLQVSLNQLVMYYFTILLISRITGFYFDERVQSEIRDGTFSKYILRPVNFSLYTIFINLGGKLFNFFFLYFPVMLILLIVFKSQILFPSLPNMLFFTVSLVLAYFINLAISLLVTTAAFFWEQSNSLVHAKWMLESVAGGYMLPLYLYPNLVQNLFNFLPFKYLFYFPAIIFAGQLSLQNALSGIAIGFFWAVTLSIAAHFFWKSGIKKYISVGG